MTRAPLILIYYTLYHRNRMQTAAFAQDPTDPGALNSLANFYLHKWFALPARGAVIESSHDVTVEVEGDKVVTFEQGDLIRLGEHFVARVVSVGPDGDNLKLDVSTFLDGVGGGN